MTQEKKWQVLVVDDETLIRNVVEKFLERIFPDANVFLEENGEAAWEYLQSNPVDIVISDIDMPKMDGLELLKEVKESFPEIFFICMSGNPNNFEKAEGLGVDYFLDKPFTKAQFHSSLEKFLE